MPDTMDKNNEIIRLPMLALRGLNVFPGMIITFDVERPASVAALKTADRISTTQYSTHTNT